MHRKYLLIIMTLLVTGSVLLGQVVPDLKEYKTLKCDFHMHTVFSDGYVWPTLRIDEALDEGLDAIAITDHLEYQPHKKHVSTDRNVSNEIARNYARRKGMICIAGAEITRWMPPGHLNVLFIEDANKLMSDDFLTVMEEAIDQGAYVFWNHPGWIVHQPDKVVRWYDIHQTLVDRGWLHGIEFANTHEYYPASIDLALEHGLALFGNTDAHGMIYRDFLQTNAHRPLTLVFAKEKSKKGIREALFAGRTIALSEDNVMAGSEALTREFVTACLTVTQQEQGPIMLTNNSEIPFIFMHEGEDSYPLPPLSMVVLPETEDNIWCLENVLTGSKEHLELILR